MTHHWKRMIDHAYDGIETCQDKIDLLATSNSNIMEIMGSCVERIEKLEKLYTNLARCLNDIPLLVQDAQEAREMFRDTLHDLQMVQRKRDDTETDTVRYMEQLIDKL